MISSGSVPERQAADSALNLRMVRTRIMSDCIHSIAIHRDEILEHFMNEGARGVQRRCELSAAGMTADGCCYIWSAEHSSQLQQCKVDLPETAALVLPDSKLMIALPSKATGCLGCTSNRWSNACQMSCQTSSKPVRPRHPPLSPDLIYLCGQVNLC